MISMFRAVLLERGWSFSVNRDASGAVVSISWIHTFAEVVR